MWQGKDYMFNITSARKQTKKNHRIWIASMPETNDSHYVRYKKHCYSPQNKGLAVGFRASEQVVAIAGEYVEPLQ